MALAIPADLHHDETRASIAAGGCTVVDYAADRATVGLQVVVTEPTIVYVHEGLKELSSGSGSETVGAASGSAVAIRSGTHLMSDLLPLSDRYRSTIVSVERETLRALVGTVDGSVDGPPACVAPIDTRLEVLATGLRARLGGSGSAVEHSLAIKELLVSTLLDRGLRRTLAADLDGWGPTPHDRIRCIVGRHRFDPLSVSQYASMCAMSLSTFKRRFQETYGAPPGRWLIDARLERAAQLLAAGELPVTAICLTSGFGDLSNFTRAFGARFGAPPTKYRDRHRTGVGKAPA